MKLVLDNQCTITGAGPETAGKIRQALTMKNPAYIEAKKRERWTGNIDKVLTFYKEDVPIVYGPAPTVNISFPRGFLWQALDILGKNFIFQDDRRTLNETSFKFTGGLRPYEEKAKQDILKKDFGVLEAFMGSGKTVMALSIIAARRQPTLVLVHSKLLLYQWRDRIVKFLGIEPGLIGDGCFDIRSITVGIINSVKNRLPELPEHFGQIVVDECSLVPSAMFSVVVQAFDCKYMLGLSATPYRNDGLTNLIYWFLGNRVHLVDLKELQDTGAVLVPEIHTRKTSFDYSRVLTLMIQDDERNNMIIRDIIREIQSRTSSIVLVVSDRIEHCEILATALKAKMATAKIEILIGQIKPRERTPLVESIMAGRIDVLVATVKMLEKGFDCAGLSSLFLVTPIRFSGRLIQVVGRILRPADGKKPKVYDYQDTVFSSARARQKTYKDMGWIEDKNAQNEPNIF